MGFTSVHRVTRAHFVVYLSVIIRFPLEAPPLDSRQFEEAATTDGTAGFGGFSPKIEVIQKIAHKGEVNR